MNIDELQAGRELDALVAEKIMQLPGLERGDPNKYCGIIGHAHPQTEGEYYYRRDGFLSDSIPCYSTDIAAAWQVVEKTKLLDGFYALWENDGMWCIAEDMGYGDWSNYARAETASMTICKAALKAVEQ